MRARSPHQFHIPVMGTGFTIDTPIRVAKYGISSVMSIGDDILIEKMRRRYCQASGRPFQPIGLKEEDARARRITAYLDLVLELVMEQVAVVRAAPFEAGSDITKYFEMLPEGAAKHDYRKMLVTSDPQVRAGLQSSLRRAVVPGDIDVNIMTKLDRDEYRDGKKQPPENALAMSGLRGFARSRLSSAIVLSAGMNRRLYRYMTKFSDFFPSKDGPARKSIVLKVSDFRSAMLQSRLLARLGLWVSEYRIESGLNCGGHAFATKGKLLGPILEEFKESRGRLIEELGDWYRRALAGLGIDCDQLPPTCFTVQGGIGTHVEHQFLMKSYRISSTGWGTAFLLVPEATNLDEVHIEKLIAATDEDVELSNNSPLGIPFWSLRTSASEQTRLQRIKDGKPGSPCPQGYLVADTEFTDIPICRASRHYQKLKSEQLASQDMSPEDLRSAVDDVQARACICVDLAGGPLLKHGLSSNARTAVCCGPNIVNFNRVATLREMVDHIYGRLSLFTDPERPHMFIKELSLYVAQLQGGLARNSSCLLDQTAAYFADFIQNLQHGVEYYRKLAADFGSQERASFLESLETLSEEIEQICLRLQESHPSLAFVPAGDGGR